MRVDSQPFGQFIEEMLGVAFRAHPYKSMGIGHRSDLDNLRLEDARAFFDTYYTPQNLVIAVVGDVYPEDVKKFAKKYFERIPRRDDPPPVHHRRAGAERSAALRRSRATRSRSSVCASTVPPRTTRTTRR